MPVDRMIGADVSLTGETPVKPREVLRTPRGAEDHRQQQSPLNHDALVIFLTYLTAIQKPTEIAARPTIAAA